MPFPHPIRSLPLLLLLLPALAAATPALEVRPAAVPPRIDGVLSPGEWDGAARSDAFRQVAPGEDVPPVERTEFWVSYDRDHLYVAVRSHDSAGRAGVRAWSMQRDRDTDSDDLVRIVLDPFRNAKDGYYFALTAAGGRLDGLVQNSDQANNQWDALWFGRTSIDDGGWTAEFAIPAKSIAFNPANATWGFNVARAVRRTQEVMRWSGFVRAKPTTALPLLGEIRGVTGLEQGRGLDFRPYVTATARHDAPPTAKDLELRTGFDVIWHVTPSLAATATVNTDFADAEVDDRQVNLGRFPLFFPEKRAFFTQDAPLFTFAGLRQHPLPFFSRRIGRAPDGSKVDILGGAKLTGRVGRTTVGLLGTRVDARPGAAARTLVAGRATVGVLEESSAGLVFTHGDPRGDGDAALVGVDFNYENNRLPGNRSLVVRTGLQRSDTDRAGGAGTAATVLADYPGEPFAAYAYYGRIEDDYDPALGFVPRRGIETVSAWNRYRWRPGSPRIDRADLYVDVESVHALGGRRLDRTVWTGWELASPDDDEVSLSLVSQREFLDEPFAIQPGVVIPAGDHAWIGPHLRFESSASRPVNVEVEFAHNDFFTGHRTDYEVEFGWRPSRFVEFGVEWEFSSIRLPQGGFDVRSINAEVALTPSPDLQFGLLAQYDNLSAELGVNARVRWTVRPGNDVYLVANQGYDATSESIRPTEGEVSLKAGWTVRF